MISLGILVRDRGALFVDLLIGSGKEKELVLVPETSPSPSLSAPPPVRHGKGSHFPSRGIAALI